MPTKKVPGKPATAYIYWAVLLHVKSLLNKWDILNIFSSNLVFNSLQILVYVQFQIISVLIQFQLWIIYLFGVPFSTHTKKLKVKRVKSLNSGQFSCLLIMLLYIKVQKITCQKMFVVKKKKYLQSSLRTFNLLHYVSLHFYILYIFCYTKVLFLISIFLSLPIYILISISTKSLRIPSIEKTPQIYLLPMNAKGKKILTA